MNTCEIDNIAIKFDYVVDGGIYVVEDTKTSYHSQFVNGHESCINFFKKRIDDVGMHGKKIGENIHGERIKEDIWSDREKFLKSNKDLSKYEKNIESIHFYSGLIFILKQNRQYIRDVE